MIWITGDYHGGLEGEKIEPERFPEGWGREDNDGGGAGADGTGASEKDALIIAGDFGLPWSGTNRERREMAGLAAAPWITLFVDGNHERFPYYADQPSERRWGGRVQRMWFDQRLYHPRMHRRMAPPFDVWRLMRGQVLELGGARVFCMGGATSTDRAWRVPGESWFAEELPCDAEYEEAERSLDAVGWEVDYVVTHCCSGSVQPRALYPEPGWERPAQDRLTWWFDMLEGRLTYKRWYFGHYHHDRDIDDRHTLLYNAIIPLGESLAGAMAAGTLSGLPELD